MAASMYTLVPRTAVRAFLIAAIASLVGAALLVLALVNYWHVSVAVIGVAILAAGLVLLLVSFLAQRASMAELVLDDDGYTVVSRAGSESGQWADVTRITRAVDGRRITIHEGEQKRTQVQFNNDNRAQVDEILEEMSARLDTAKGYREWDGQ
ncbi:hypothetical protein [Tessaracoccus sp.]